MIEAARTWGVGSGASHLVSGHTREHHALEEELAQFTGRPRALLFSTGYMANLAAASVLVGRGDAVLEDRLNHASLLDAGLATRCALHALSARRRRRRCARSCSACGTRAPRRDCWCSPTACSAWMATSRRCATSRARAATRDATLLVDDAHGFGVLGATGAGAVEEAGLALDDVPVLMCTLGKAVGTFGAFIAGSEVLIESLIQRARTYIYTTALPPAVAAATRAALRVMRDEPERRATRAGACSGVPCRRRIARACTAWSRARRFSRLLVGDETRRPGGQRRVARTGHLGAGDPAADGPGRSVAPAVHVLGRTHRGGRRAIARGARGLQRRGVLGRAPHDAARRCTSRRRAPARTSCCCTAGPCTAACGARGSTNSRNTRACMSSTCRGTAAAPALASADDLAALARAVSRRRAARCGRARLVAGRHGGARAGAAAAGRPRGAGADRDDAVVRRAAGLAARHGARRARRLRARAGERLSPHDRAISSRCRPGATSTQHRHCVRCARASARTANPTREALDARTYAILREADLRADLPRIAVPTLVIAGEHDRLTPAGGGPRTGRLLAVGPVSSRFPKPGTRRSCRTPKPCSTRGPAVSDCAIVAPTRHEPVVKRRAASSRGRRRSGADGSTLPRVAASFACSRDVTTRPRCCRRRVRNELLRPARRGASWSRRLVIDLGRRDRSRDDRAEAPLSQVACRRRRPRAGHAARSGPATDLAPALQPRRGRRRRAAVRHAAAST